MIRLGLMSFSDGRPRVHESLVPAIAAHADRVCAALGAQGDIQIVPAPDIIHGNRQAAQAARWLNARDLDAVLFNIPVFAFPNYAAIAARLLHVPLLACAPVDGSLPGLGGLQAAHNMIRQSGGQCEKFYGDPEDPAHIRRVREYLLAARATVRLKGQTYGLIGGRSIGIGSGAASQDVWMRVFGVDIDHVDELELTRRAGLMEEERVLAACDWLTSRLMDVAMDGAKLTAQTLRRQIAYALAAKDIVKDREFDFIGIKCHYDLSEYDCTQCLTAALLNDPCDWDGEREPICCACEADSDGALTMRILNLISGLPALFMDFRHVERETRRLTLCNCGAMATWYAARSHDAAENLGRVTACPVIPKYGGVGAHLAYVARPGAMTFARLSHVMDSYCLYLFRGECVAADPGECEKTSPAWPHAFVQIGMEPDALIGAFYSNHVHAVYGDWIAPLKHFAALLGIRCELIQ